MKFYSEKNDNAKINNLNGANSKLKINISKDSKFSIKDSNVFDHQQMFSFNRPINLKAENFQNINLLSSSKENGRKLRKKLADLIKTKGPINLYEYMNICLYDKAYGYYTTKEHIFGAKGDFITSPEISQMFGEIIGIWIFKVIEGFKFPDKIDIVEIGAGRGFMMSDIIRTLITFKRNHELNFYICEKSEKLAKIQQENITNMLLKEKIFMEYRHDKV